VLLQEGSSLGSLNLRGPTWRDPRVVGVTVAPAATLGFRGDKMADTLLDNVQVK
jgi:hypothetical protein